MTPQDLAVSTLDDIVRLKVQIHELSKHPKTGSHNKRECKWCVEIEKVTRCIESHRKQRSAWLARARKNDKDAMVKLDQLKYRMKRKVMKDGVR